MISDLDIYIHRGNISLLYRQAGADLYGPAPLTLTLIHLYTIHLYTYTLIHYTLIYTYTYTLI